MTLAEQSALSDQPLMSPVGSFPSHRQEVAESSGHRAHRTQAPDLIWMATVYPTHRNAPCPIHWGLVFVLSKPSSNRSATYASQTDGGYPGYTCTHSPYTCEHTCSVRGTYIPYTHIYTHRHKHSHNVLHEHPCIHTCTRFLHVFKHEHNVLHVYMYPFIYRSLSSNKQGHMWIHRVLTHTYMIVHTHMQKLQT